MRNRVYLGAALSLVILSTGPALAETNERPGSAYVQCDGQPDNVTDGETAARLIGAITLLGLFAPPHEAADASKRKFGAEGVAACTSLLSGDHQEGNTRRRLGLILGRAIHQIEAKNYDAALSDVAMARREAQAAGLMNDPYFVRSRGRGFDAVEAAALVRMGRPEEARTTGLRDLKDAEYSFFPLFSVSSYDNLIPTVSPDEARISSWRTRIFPVMGGIQADRLELAGRFTESAKIRDELVEFDAVQTPELNSSTLMARAAVAHALAGEFDAAAEQAKAARANADHRREIGKPEPNEALLVELLDLYSIIDSAHAGDVQTARRMFAGRSEWVDASLGAVLEVNKRLRAGAAKDELIGGLTKSPEELWNDHVATVRAAMLAKDSDNKTLFTLLPAEHPAKLYQSVAKDVWRTDKSKIILKTKADPAKEPMELMYLPLVSPIVALDAYLLHAALISRARGYQGFVFSPVITDKLIAASFRPGNRGDKGFPPELFMDANDVIAKLSAEIPQPASQ